MSDRASAIEAEARGAWQVPLVLLVSTLALAAAAYWGTIAAIVGTWLRSDTYAHGLLILPISLLLIWRRRAALFKLNPRAWPPALALVAACVSAWLLAGLADVLVVQQFAVVALVPALVLLFLGRAVASALLFPLAYLFFAVPFGEFLVPRLQDFTAVFAVQGLRLSGVPVFWEDRYISIPGGNFIVAEACSGVRYLIASAALGTLYAYLMYRSWQRRLAFVAASLLVPILANGLRAYGIIMLAWLSDMRLATSVDHLFYGWLFFGLVMLLLFWVGSFWRQPAGAPRNAPAAAPPAAPPPAMAASLLIVAWLSIAAASAAAVWLQAGDTDRQPHFAFAPPAPEGAWSGPYPAEHAWTPVFEGNPSIGQWTYEGSEGQVHLLLIFYPTQGQGAELLGSLNAIYDGDDWRRFGERRLPPRAVAGLEHGAIETLIGGAQTRRVSMHWYRMGGRATADRVAGKLLQAWQRLRGEGSTAMLVAVGADYELSPDEARRVLDAFLRDMAPRLAGFWPTAVPAGAADASP